MLSCTDTNSWRKYIEAKVQGNTYIMNVCDTSSHGDTLRCQIWYGCVKGQKCCDPIMKPCQKPYKYDPKAKGQRCIRIMNLHIVTTHCLMVIHLCAKYDIRNCGLDMKPC